MALLTIRPGAFSMKQNHLAAIGAAMLAALVSTGVSGCGGYSAAAHRVAADEARSTLDAVLKSWQEGETPDAWQQKTPAVVVQDMEWKSGVKLISFEMLESQAIDANLHCRVKLILDTPQRGQVERTVKYLVGTSPVLTVFRALEP
jgi:hypothetical protein